MPSLLEVRHLNVRYGGVRAVQDVGFTMEEGEWVALIGANGAGKSTTLNAISGVVSYDGDIVFEGVSLRKRKAESIVRTGIVQVPEGRRVFPGMSVLENLELGGYARRREGRMKRNIERVLDMFPRLRERSKQLAGTLSGGEQQMLALGRALMAEPKLMMLDEPSLGLAPLVIDQIFEALTQIRHQRVSILLVEQNAAKALEFADRCYLLETGRVVMSGTAEEIRKNPVVQEVYLGM